MSGEAVQLSGREDVVVAIREALQGTREYRAGVAFAVPTEAHEEHGTALAEAANGAVVKILRELAVYWASPDLMDAAAYMEGTL